MSIEEKINQMNGEIKTFIRNIRSENAKDALENLKKVINIKQEVRDFNILNKTLEAKSK